MKWRYLFALGLCGALAFAEEVKPDVTRLSLWEVGIVGGGSYLPDYPAAAQNHFKWIVAPYVIYRGKIIRADREGARAELLDTRFIKLELSVAAAFATSSKNNDARDGMPDLDYLVELGPRATVPLSDLGGRGKLQLFLPVRAAFSTDLSNVRHRGYSYTPAIYGLVRGVIRPSWFLIGQLTSTFGSRDYNGYVYDVGTRQVRTDRPEYHARIGYSGTDIFSGLVIPIGERWRLFGGGQISFHDGSANEQSPLFKRRLNGALILGATWAFFQSAEPARSF